MKKKIFIEATGASDKQWSVLVLELNVMKTAWKKFGVTLNLHSPDAKRIIAWGNKNYDDVKDDNR
tara:strand:- start:344 stop:538 length:195 start_codon:yes stop_codon:yes gene_type:complete